MRLTRILSTLALGIVLFSAATMTARAGSIVFTANLLGSNEVPPKVTTATGLATLVLDDVTGQATLTISFKDLSSALTGAHIHAPAPAGVNTGVLQGFNTFLTMAPDNKSGSLSNFVLPFTLTAQQIADLKAGLWYVNVHSSINPGGEIRGQLQAAVPEPQTLSLLGGGLIGLVALLRRRRT